ncbi:MAG: hypothetical protein GY816_06035 [Cytophagales bacterium]|nr:hypothetical protein [Cytophagales bacterium]
MKAVEEQYTVKPEYVEKQSQHQKGDGHTSGIPNSGMHYASFTLDDGETFVHINMATDDETMGKLQEVEEFNLFRTALKASEPVSPPKSESLNLVAAGFELD